MVMIPKQLLIERLVEEKVIEQPHAEYIGASGLGHKCRRKVWYDFHWAYPRIISARLARIFAHGDYEETKVIQDLESIGVAVIDRQREYTDSTGHIRGHVDGIVTNVPDAPKTNHLLEVKTMNDSRFKEYLKKGLKFSNPTYWVQAHMYMGWAKLSRCLYVVTNKNDESRSYERIPFEKQVFIESSATAFKILTSESAPERIGNAMYFDCKWCDAKKICHFGQEPAINCRTCRYGTIENHGVWSCGNTNLPLTVEEQRNGCAEYDADEWVHTP